MIGPAATARRVPGEPRLLVCPDSFKGTFPARDVAAALSRGIEDAGGRPAILPLADGGEGTSEALLDAVGESWVTVTASGPPGAPMWHRPGSSTRVASTVRAATG